MPFAANLTKTPARWAMTMPMSIRNIAPAVLISSCDKDFLNIFNEMISN
jgi:hypothetical protein